MLEQKPDENENEPVADVEGNSGDTTRRMTEAEWAQCVEAYELGIKGTVELAAEFGVTRQALYQRFRSNGIIEGSRAHEIKDAVKEAAKAQAEKFADNRMDWIEETRINGYNALKQAQAIATKIVAEALKKSDPMQTVNEDLKAVKRFQDILVDNINTRLGPILNSDQVTDEESLPSLMLEDLTAEEVIEHHRDIGALDEDTDIDQLLKSVDVEIGEMQ